MPLPPRRAALLAHAALVAAWLLLHAPALAWVGRHFARSPLHAGIVLVAAALLLRGASFATFRGALDRRPPPAAVALLAASAVAFTACERRLGTTTVSALLLGLGAYGLVGLHLDPARFRRALPGALLLVALLPFGEQVDTYFGFAARALTARVVASLLAALGHPAMPVETLLVLENGVAHVDVPCSGARSLWTGLLFFLAATSVLGRGPGLRWLLAGLAHLALLLVENLVRVAAITLLAVALHAPHLAEIVHAPIGILGFALACAATLAVLRRFVPAPAPLPAPASAADRRPLAPALAAALLALALLRAPPAAHAAVAPSFHLDLGPEIAASPLPLTVAEEDLFRRFGGSADKRAFRMGALSGSLLAVKSRSFRAHHPPEICLASSGVRIEDLRAVSLGQGADVRVASADGGRRTAIYWFQSPTRVTADLAARVWAEASFGERRWVQISIIVDAPLSLNSPEGLALVARIRAAAARALAEESP